jgi:hypothetical protein
MLSNYPDHSNNLGSGAGTNPLSMIPLPASPNRRPSPALQTASNTSTAFATPGGSNMKNPYNVSMNQYQHMMLGATLSAQNATLHPSSLM